MNQYAPMRSMSIASNNSLSQIGKLNQTLNTDFARSNAMNEMGQKQAGISSTISDVFARRASHSIANQQRRSSVYQQLMSQIQDNNLQSEIGKSIKLQNQEMSDKSRMRPAEITVEDQAQAIFKQIQRMQGHVFNEATSTAIQQAITKVLIDQQ